MIQTKGMPQFMDNNVLHVSLCHNMTAWRFRRKANCAVHSVAWQLNNALSFSYRIFAFAFVYPPNVNVEIIIHFMSYYCNKTDF